MILEKFYYATRGTVLCISLETRTVTYLVKYNYSAWPGRRLKWCKTHDSLGPKIYWLEVSKKVKHDLVPQGAPKLQDVKFWSFFFQIWHLVTFMYLEVQGRVLPFWKPLINIFKEPDCHGCWSALNVCQAMLKNCIHFSTLMHMTVSFF